MPVDIFGHTDVKTSQRTVSGGVTLSQVNNTFLRRDGETAADGDINLNAHKLVNVKDPVDAQDAATRSYVDTTKVSKSGDTITGDLKLLLNDDNIRTFGVGDITIGKSVSLQLGDSLNQIRHNFGHALKIGAVNSVKVTCPVGEVCRMGTLNSKNIQMNDNFITNLHDPSNPQDAATKAYVDAVKNCNVGYVPRLTSNTNYRGFSPSASSEFDSNYIAANAFNGDYVSGPGGGGEWATKTVNTNFWIKIGCPTAVRTWKFGFRGRDGNKERLYNWRVEGSTDNTNWAVLYTPPSRTFLGNTYQEFLIDSIQKFNYFRLYCVNAEPLNPGLSTMQIFVYDD